MGTQLTASHLNLVVRVTSHLPSTNRTVPSIAQPTASASFVASFSSTKVLLTVHVLLHLGTPQSAYQVPCQRCSRLSETSYVGYRLHRSSLKVLRSLLLGCKIGEKDPWDFPLRLSAPTNTTCQTSLTIVAR